MEKCKFCNKEYVAKSNYYNKINLNKHMLRCLLNPDHVKYRCVYCGHEEESSPGIGSHLSICKSNPDYDNISLSRIKNGKLTTGRKHSQETKDKISQARIKYLSENPDKVPHLVNHSSKESYPEKYFTDVFERENIDVIKDLE
jgi:hypothetical protein